MDVKALVLKWIDLFLDLLALCGVEEEIITKIEDVINEYVA